MTWFTKPVNTFCRCLPHTLLIALACLGRASEARAEGNLSEEQAACVKNYESAQEHRLQGALRAALPELSACAEGACPAFIRADCATWSSEVEQELPSVVFSIRSAGQSIEQVRISVDGAPVAERVPDQPLSVDPGNHVFTFEGVGAETSSQTVIVERGQKARSIEVDLRPLASVDVTPPPADSPVREPPLPASAAPAFDSRLLALGVIGVGGITGFALLGLHARSEEARLRNDCAPSCSDSEVSGLHAQYLIADVSLGIGVTSLVWGSYLFLSSARARSGARVSVPLSVAVSPSSASASFRGTF
jgi:hypothetical protein